MTLQAPFVYFGGKSKIADIVWQALGQVKSYIEPFAGSLAVLLARENYNAKLHIETINDKDGFITNVWRSLQNNPDEVAKYCDYPVSHIELSARKINLIKNENYLVDGLKDVAWYDAKLAGYWIWAASCWIGSGLTRTGSIPDLANSGIGVHKVGQIPHLIGGGKGVHKLGQRPHLTGGMGVHKMGKRPHLTGGGMGVQDPYNTNIYAWFRQLSERLRYVRTFCGDWKRVCGGDWQDNRGDVGLFIDPPYGILDRDTKLYHHDNTDIAKDVLKWCKERGSRETYKIVLSGYEEYQELVDSHGWSKELWKAQGGYSNIGKGKNNNRHRETLYFSPHTYHKEGKLF